MRSSNLKCALQTLNALFKPQMHSPNFNDLGDNDDDDDDDDNANANAQTTNNEQAF